MTRKTSWVLALPTAGAVILGTMGGALAAPVGPHIGGSISIVASPHGPWADVFNPFAPGETQNDIVGDIYEPLVEWNGSNGAHIPWLAQSWAWSQGNKVLTLNLRHGVRFTNGQLFTSADVVFTLNMMKKYPAIDSSGLWSYMTSVKAEGPYRVKITINKPDSTFLYYLTGTYMVPASLWKNKNPVTWTDPHPVGTGPYKLQSFSAQDIILTRNPHYWQPGKPYLKTVSYPSATSNSAVILGLANGSVQWSSIYSPNLRRSFVSKNPKTNHTDVSSGGYDWLYVNLHQYPLNMLPVRRAISDAINRKALSIISESGYSTPSQLDGIDAAQKSWSTPALNKQAAAVYNPKAARSILAKAGFKKGPGGMWLTPKGKPFTVNLVTASPFTDFVSMTSQLSSMLHAVGINTTITVTSVSNYSNKMADGHFSLGVMWGPSGPNPFYTLNPLMNTEYSAPLGKPAPDNIERYSNPRIQALAAQYNGSTSVAVHKAVVHQMASIMATQLPVIGLLNRNSPNEFSSAHIAGWPSGPHPYWNNAADVGPIVVLTHLYAKK